MFLTNRSPHLSAFTLCTFEKNHFLARFPGTWQIRMKILDIITSGLLLIFPDISENIQFLENLQAWSRVMQQQWIELNGIEFAFSRIAQLYCIAKRRIYGFRFLTGSYLLQHRSPWFLMPWARFSDCAPGRRFPVNFICFKIYLQSMNYNWP